MKVLILVSRVFQPAPTVSNRALIYLEYLNQRNFETKVLPLGPPFIDKMRRSEKLILRILGRIITNIPVGPKRENLIYLLIRYFHQKKILKSINNYDCVYIVKYAPLWLIKEIKKTTPIVFDFTDAVWRPGFVDYIRKEIFEILKQVDVVTTDNQYMLGISKEYNSKSVVIPAIYPESVVSNKRKWKSIHKVQIVWVGSVGTSHYLHNIFHQIKPVLSVENISLTILGAKEEDFDCLNLKNVHFILNYNEEEMLSILNEMHLGLMPLTDCEDAKARGYGKAILYMSSGVVPICSSVGTVIDIIKDNINGFLVIDELDWAKKISEIVANISSLENISNNGKIYVRNNFSYESVCKNFEEALNLAISN